MDDPKRELVRHVVATIAFRMNVAVREAPESFGEFGFQDGAGVRTPSAILAHIGDLLTGSLFLLEGEMRELSTRPLPWAEEIARVFNAADELDAFLAGDALVSIPLERLMQGPLADALTHIGQIVLLRRVAGSPIRSEPYFEAEIEPGRNVRSVA